MTFAPQWDATYRRGEQMPQFPFSDLVSLVKRFAKPYGRVLELGFGNGANIPFLAAFGVKYYGIDGSEHITAAVQARYPGAFLACGDFTQYLPFDGTVDLVVDRAAVTHNDAPSIAQALKLAAEKMAPDALYIGCDWFSTQDGDCHGILPTTKMFDSGRFAGLGPVHFASGGEIVRFLEAAGLKLEHLAHKTVQVYTDDSARVATWQFVAKKP